MPHRNPPPGYHHLDGCHNCASCRVDRDPDSVGYWCCHGLEGRMPSRDDFSRTFEGTEQYIDALGKYEHGPDGEFLAALVSGHGKCDEWTRREEPPETLREREP